MERPTPSTPRYALRWNDRDRELARELSRLTGVRNCSDVIRNAMRAHYRALTRRPFKSSAEVPATKSAAGG
jgi:hypothetical protein